MVVEVGRDGAFSVNRVGLEGKPPFPLSFSVREGGGSWMIRGSAARAAELADVLMRTVGDTVVVADLCTNSFLDENYVQWRPSRIAAEQGISWQARSLGALASGVAGLSEEVLAIRPDDLPRFLAGWSPYELTLADMPGRPTAERLDEIAVAIGTAAPGEPVLPSLPGSRLLYCGHDDCYLAVESTDPSVPAALLSRLLALLARSALAGASPAEVPEPADALVTSLIEDSAHWTGVLGTASRNTVTVNLTALAEPWRLGRKPLERADRLAICDMRQGSWRLARSGMQSL